MAFNPNNPAASGMVLTFDDEFNTLSASNAGPGGGQTWMNHIWYSQTDAGSAINDPSMLSTHDGVLDITAKTVNGAWHSGTLESVDSSGQGFAQKFGYFEVRAKIPAGQGLIPTFYLMAQPHITNAANTSVEMDILESKASTPSDLYTTLHKNSGTSQDQQNGPLTHIGVDTSQDYHTYGMYWDPNSPNITFYFDGKPIMNVPKYSTTDSSPEAMILQLLTGTWGGNPDGSTPNPSHLLVDYVRAWQFPDQHPAAVTAQAVSNPYGQAATNGSVLPGQTADAGSTGGSTPTQPTQPTQPSTGSSTGTSTDPASADGAVVLGTNGHIVTDAHNVFAINAAGQITENGNVMAQTGAVTELTYLHGTLYQEATAKNLWWSFDESHNTWTQVADPHTTSSTGSTGGSTPTQPTQPSSGSSTAAPQPFQTFSDNAGHEVFLISSMNQAGHTISNYDPALDILDVAPLLKAVGYAGHDPLGDHVLALVQSGADTNLMIDTHGTDAAHGQVLVTLQHVLPSQVPASDIWH